MAKICVVVKFFDHQRQLPILICYCSNSGSAHTPGHHASVPGNSWHSCLVFLYPVQQGLALLGEFLPDGSTIRLLLSSRWAHATDSLHKSVSLAYQHFCGACQPSVLVCTNTPPRFPIILPLGSSWMVPFSCTASRVKLLGVRAATRKDTVGSVSEPWLQPTVYLV